MHDVLCDIGWYVPSGQAMHVSRPLDEYVPGWHIPTRMGKNLLDVNVHTHSYVHRNYVEKYVPIIRAVSREQRSSRGQ